MLVSVALGIYVVALVGAGLSDLVRFEIPNALSVVLVAAFMGIAPALPMSSLVWHVALALFILAGATAGFALRVVGGGDVKLLAATALWMGWRNLPSFILLTAFVGAGLGAMLLVLRRWLPRARAAEHWYRRLLSPAEGVPYGVAISVAGLSLLPRLGPVVLH